MRSLIINLKKYILSERTLVFFLLFFIPLLVKSQYFGRNKPAYSVFDYKVYQTPNFDIYHYLTNDSVLNNLANRAEEWYKHHQEIFRDTIHERNPIIFYQNHADFQQTNAVSGMMEESTGGVTEALKQRVVLPITPSLGKTDHVLGHELVHAFQFNALINDDSLKLSNLNNLPLWMMEGMAEYLSIGSVDPHTAMWMRDAVLKNDIPTLKDMTRSNKYFPYRYGQALLAMIGKTWGDSVIVPLFRETAIKGYDKAVKSVLDIDEKKLSELWRTALIANYSPYLTDTIDNQKGKRILFEKNAGDINISPSVSPDGKYVVFLSEKDVFSLDLFLADARNGKILRKLSSRINQNEVDALSFMESSGTWSPDSRYFAFIVFSEGKNKLVIMDVPGKKVTEEISLPGLPAISNPAWSPDGKYIAVTGMKNGVSDLFLYEVYSKKLIQITDDPYSQLQPAWSPDGKYIAFVTDKPLPGQEIKFKMSHLNIALIQPEVSDFEVLLPLFPGAANMNPVYSADGNSIYFLSDRDGFRNLYRYKIEDKTIWQQTKYMRGISGITSYSPAISLARETGEIVYSYYKNGKYQIFNANPEDFNEFQVNPQDVDFSAATLPPLNHIDINIIDNSLLSELKKPDIQVDSFKDIPYRPKFKLDYISNVSTGISTSRLGTGMAGSVSAIFGDMVGDNQIFAALALNGEIYDFGGQVAYLNQKKKIRWGAALSHVPNYYGFASLSPDTLTINGEPYPVTKMSLDYMRMFEDKVELFAFYPLSQTRRFELSGALGRYSFRYDQYNTYYDIYGRPIGADRDKLEAPDGFNLHNIEGAYVLDNSRFGITGPIDGTRYRIELGKYFGEYGHFSTLIDYRKYIYLRPYTLAFRTYNYGRWGEDSGNSRLSPMYIGYPWLIRGYERNDARFNSPQSNGLGINNFFGSKIAVSNIEFRIPLTGPDRVSLIKSKMLFMDLNFFMDGGIAWNEGDKLGNNWLNPSNNEKVPVFSYGASIRLNLFGYAVIEPFYAVPVQKGYGITKGSFGVSFFPGW